MALTTTHPAAPDVRTPRLLPGVALCAAVGAAALAVSAALPELSPLLLAILTGVALANSGGLPAVAQPGLTWSAKRLLRAGVVLLGLQLSLTDVVGLGPRVVVLLLAVVLGGIRVAFGTAMIGIVPLLAAAAGLSSHAAGLLAGGSVHEVAQVVAAGGILGGGALGTAVVVKLARVLMLAPVLAWVGWRRRSSPAAGGTTPRSCRSSSPASA